MSGTIAVIVASYNRPRMLADALASIDAADEVLIADDGSDFDVAALAAPFRLPGLQIVANLPRSPRRRMQEPSCGRLINRAIRATQADYLAFLCDDDLYAPGWLAGARAALDYYPHHMVSGDWRVFNDGEPLSSSKRCPFYFHPPLTTGNFACRRSCVVDEGCWWSERTLAVHDGTMLHNYIARHAKTEWLAALELLAGYRREHPKTISNNCRPNDSYTPVVETYFAAGAGGME